MTVERPYLIILPIGFFTFLLGLALFGMGKSAQNYSAIFEKQGIRATAQLIGYKYVSCSGRGCGGSGDRPVFSYRTLEGKELTYVAYGYGLATDLKKSELVKQTFQIIYLPKQPSIARINRWWDKPSSGWVEMLLGTLVCLLSLLAFWEAWRLTSNESSRSLE